MMIDEISGRAGRAGATAVDLPDTPQGGARRMRWLHMSSIILGILCIGIMGLVKYLGFPP